MKHNGIPALLLCAVLLSGCGLLKQKTADYYLGKARKTASAQNPPQAELEAAYAGVEKALAYEPGSSLAVEILEDLTRTAAKTGFAAAPGLEAAALKKALAGSPYNWRAREALINFYAERGETAALDAMAAQAKELAASKDPGVRYCATLSALAARASALPWLESEGYLALNKTPQAFFDKTAAYVAAAELIPAMKAETDRMIASDPSLRKAAPEELVSAAEVAAMDAMKDSAAASAVIDFNTRAATDQAFRKAVEMLIQGNAALAGKDYPQARAFFQGALNQYPGLVDARRQLAEADFQEGAALAASGGDPKAASQLLYRAYAATGEVLAAAKNGGLMPFIRPDRFLGEVYSLKAADLAALRAVEGKKLRNTAKLESEFKGALDEALRLNPEGRLARELYERYSKEGF